MPINVKRFVWLSIASFIASFTAALFLPPPTPEEVQVGITPTVQLALVGIITSIFAIVLIPLYWFAAWKRKNWARWTLLAWVLFSASTAFWDYVDARPTYLISPLPELLLDYLSVALDTFAFYFVFTGDARPWFNTLPATPEQRA